ncbi:transcriptional regulator [Bacillus coahuilensis m2-6]|uniref:transcription repressor NadR n=1 Tax=Bacillus coahuilensis TaxID=408580 RepID=UPI00075060F2|nr:transcription repressor NadR [Bacillus coahuilensis]KUP06950.1 transcriptional regulator [Bacillus coahuilensis m2-6]
MGDKKLLGEERRAFILDKLKQSAEPLTGKELSLLTNVSRQVVVNDITLLKARNIPIIATSQGYLYLQQDLHTPLFEKTVPCLHGPERTKEELELLVDLGVTVKDVIIEHPVYGDLTASVHVSNRKDVERFMSKLTVTGASLLSELTEGVHLHTLQSASEEKLLEAEALLKEKGFLISS